MKAKVKGFDLEVEPMTKYDYNGFYCNWNGYKFWIDEIDFNKIYTIEE